MTDSYGAVVEEHALKEWFTYRATVCPGANTRSQCAVIGLQVDAG